MSGVETERPASQESDRDLDEWFVRRLEDRGIPVRAKRPPTNRVLAVASIAVATLALLWAFSAGGSSSSSTTSPGTTQSTTPTTTTTNPTGGTTGGGKNGGKKTTIVWSNVPVDVLNGYGGPGAAAAAEQQLSSEGWKVAATGDAGDSTAQTIVVYAPGHKPQAAAVAKKLGLGAPVAIADATGVPSDATTGVAIVLGPNGLG
jgi:LytR cell envelope-related transcriptional attenuator